MFFVQLMLFHDIAVYHADLLQPWNIYVHDIH